MSEIRAGSQAWLDQVVEDVIDPERPIIDPHHHLWERPGLPSYGLPELRQDTGSGHRIEKTVFIECRAFYRQDGPEHLRVVGETERVAAIARESRAGGPGKAVIAGIVAVRGPDARRDVLEEVLDAHLQAGDGMFRGIRHAGAHEPDPSALTHPGTRSARTVRARGLPQRPAHAGPARADVRHVALPPPELAFAELARAVPDTPLMLDHFGTPLGVGRYAGQREAIFAQWKLDIAEIARCRNVVAKLGGLAMPDNGFGWDKRDRPASSDELVAAQRSYYRHVIECFGPDRCMFESNFPVDKRSISYRVVWNAFKKMAADLVRIRAARDVLRQRGADLSTRVRRCR